MAVGLSRRRPPIESTDHPTRTQTSKWRPRSQVGPIDGTVNFLCDLPVVSVSIAATEPADDNRLDFTITAAPGIFQALRTVVTGEAG